MEGEKIAIIIILIILIMWCSNSASCEEPTIMVKNNNFYIIDSGIPGPCIGIISGMHGNERSGPIELYNFINKINKTHHFPRHGKLKIIPCANIQGFNRNSRWLNWKMHDLNRIFDQKNNPNVSDILDFFKDCNLIIDFHEAWSWHLIDNASLGNTITPTEGVDNIANDLCQLINSNPKIACINSADPRKRFTIGDSSLLCDFSGALSCWMETRGLDYILVEIAGQNDVQPLDVRREIVRTIIFFLMTAEL